jgi:hypothetical protein
LEENVKARKKEDGRGWKEVVCCRYRWVGDTYV